MARVESERTRQALLVVGTSMETSPPPDKLELFLEDGTPVDVGKDRTRARWRGTWTDSPDAPYEQNDFVLDNDKLYILADPDLVEEGIGPSASTSGAWVLMTISGGMIWAGEYDPDLTYPPNSVVSYLDGLYIASSEMAEGIVPGALAAPTVGSTKVGNAMFGGTVQAAYVAVPDVPILDAYLPFLPHSSTNFAGGSYIRVNAGLGEEVTLEWSGGPIHLFDGEHGDNIVASGPLASDVSDASSPLTFTVDNTSTTGGSGVAHVAVELDASVSEFTWVVTGDAPAEWEVISEPPLGELLVSALPSSPVDGQVIFYQNAAMAALGVVWQLRYRAAASGSYKWEFVGGAPLYLYDSAQYGGSVQVAYGYAGTAQLLVPLAGDYEVSLANGLATDSTATTTKLTAGIGVTGAVPSKAEWSRYAQATEQYGTIHGGFSGVVLTALAQAAVMRPMFKGTAGLIWMAETKIAIRPVRVG